MGYFSTSGWEQDHSGVHPVEMMARIATFQSKQEAQYEQYRKPFNRKGNSDFNKIVVCTYDGIESFGNGKLEKQAKLVSARNMICKLKQFNMFKSAGTLSSSFVKASTNSTNPTTSNTEVTPSEDKEVEKYKAYIEGKISDPSEKLPLEAESDSYKTKIESTAPHIVFKRGNSELSNKESEPLFKKNKSEEVDNLTSYENSGQEGSVDWNPDNYGYANNYSWRGRGTGGFHRGGWRG